MLNRFSEFQLPETLIQGLNKLNFTEPTPIQEKAIPVAIAGKDILGCAQTGTGKTAAFVIPMVVRLMQNKDDQALILAPTRELAVQIYEFIQKLTMGMKGMTSTLLIGGAPMFRQMKSLKKNPRVIVATPGRLNDHIKSRNVRLNQTRYLVLDEADRMMDMGFLPQVEQVLETVPNQRQTLLFSATFPDAILKLATRFQKDAESVQAGAVSTPIEKIEQKVVETDHKSKNNVLMDLLNEKLGEEQGKNNNAILIFARTKSRTDKVARLLGEHGFPVTRIHGDRSQGQRQQAIQGFRSGQYRVMVATDIAARGLDIPQIALVINYDLPEVPEDYIHRIGRTARANATGQAVCLLTPDSRVLWRRIQARIGNKDSGNQEAFQRVPQSQSRTRPQGRRRPGQVAGARVPRGDRAPGGRAPGKGRDAARGPRGPQEGRSSRPMGMVVRPKQARTNERYS